MSELRRAVAYVRVSTERQADEDRYGLEAQRRAITEYAERNGYEIARWYEEHASGKLDVEDREVLASILFDRDVSNPPYEAVIVFKNDRVARDMKLYFYYLYLLEKRGVQLVSVQEDFGGDPALANIYRAIMGFVAEQERKNIIVRTMSGKRAKRDAGGYSCGRVPYGYSSSNGDLVRNDAEAEAVLMVFAGFDRTGSLSSTARGMNESGIPTRSGGTWHPSTVKSIIDRRDFYRGYSERTDGTLIRGAHEPLLGD